MLPGPTPEQSIMNLYAWLDAALVLETHLFLTVQGGGCQGRITT